MPKIKRGYLFGVVLVVIGGICLSLAGILLRHVESASGWQILFYRALSFFLTLSLIIFLRYRTRTLSAFKNVGVRGLLVALSLGLGSVCYIFAILLTTVANAVFIIGAAPLLTAALGWLFLRERISALSGVAMLAALVGIGFMFTDGIIAGRWLGNLMAVMVVVSFAVMLVILRGSRNKDMLPATCMAGIVTAVVAGIMVTDFTISNHDLVIAVLLGSVQFSAGFVLITIGTRYIPAAQVALFSLTESLFAPMWVWIGVGEVPSALTITGCVIVFIAVAGNGVINIRDQRNTGSSD